MARHKRDSNVQVQELEDANRLTPVIHDDDVSYLYVQVRGWHACKRHEHAKMHYWSCR